MQEGSRGAEVDLAWVGGSVAGLSGFVGVGRTEVDVGTGEAMVGAGVVVGEAGELGGVCYRNFPVFVGAGCSLSTLGRWPARSHSMVWTL
ncbi:hypothetical protein [Amycolatopsis sp. La24]|uniref:hypothetical protein n=1 Tax=Amycolatopsis sp. La24 TaxID=3028304 RepID=UPI0023B1ADC4|nr:hypothetical protein [Amycolatopsis sp. La24]